MLFTDSDIVTAAALAQIDSEVASVAATTKPVITIEGPASVCALAWQECGRRILAAQQMYTSYLASPGMTGGGLAAVWNTGVPAARNQSRTRLNQIVATESQYANSASAVEMWMAYTALSMFYRDASARLGKDRLQEKYERYGKDADFAWRQLRQVGLPYLTQPLECPGARHGANAGTWGPTNLSTIGGSGTAQALQVAITYYDSSRYVSEVANGNAESAPSVVFPIAQALGQVLRVSIASLNPPTGQMDRVGLSSGLMTPLNASHWILWIGVAGGPLYWQAATPIGTKTVTLVADPVTTGYMMGGGQVPDLALTFQNTVGRG
jgi:hypothetical protein